MNIRQLSRAKLIAERKRGGGNESDGGQAILDAAPLVLGTRREADDTSGGALRPEKRRKVLAAVRAKIPNLSHENDDQVRPFPPRVRCGACFSLKLGLGP